MKSLMSNLLQFPHKAKFFWYSGKRKVTLLWSCRLLDHMRETQEKALITHDWRTLLLAAVTEEGGTSVNIYLRSTTRHIDILLMRNHSNQSEPVMKVQEISFPKATCNGLDN